MFYLIFLAQILVVCYSQNALVAVKLLIIVENGQETFTEWIDDALSTIKATPMDSQTITVQHDAEDSSKVCNAFTTGSTIVVDLTWSGNERAKAITSNLRVPYIRIDLSISPALNLLDKYLTLRNSSDVVTIFDDAKKIDQALYYWLDSTRLRMVISDKLDKVSAQRLKTIRPTPNSYAIVASTRNMSEIYETAQQEGLIKLPERWNLLFLDLKHDDLKLNPMNPQVNLLKINKEVCCRLEGLGQECICPESFIMQRSFLKLMLEELAGILSNLTANGYEFSQKIVCYSQKYNNTITRELLEQLNSKASNENSVFRELNGVYKIRIAASVETAVNPDRTKVIAKFNDNQDLIVEEGVDLKPVKAFYRIGVTYETDPSTGKLQWTGYCIDFVRKLAEVMNFDYELVEPESGRFGQKNSDGRWDGVIGDITRGETDLAVSALIMTADREEVVDFVAPYFEQSGISIVMRKPVRKTSLFKFMTVLKLEVWLSIVAALVVTAFMIWFLDKYSPYSAKNNRKAYPYECRDFSLKESFWFALTSFTPQGGGEAPKSLSARTLVAAYWLFVVLMLATFTANLAAFLTVERMQTPVQSLEQLARQSRINYTVVKESDTHKYFINMKNAEDTLYRMWKELTLNASTDETQYRVWDYPIREQYGHILLAINDSMPVVSASEGFRLVNERIDGDFAFIHDSSEIKYEISKNCNFTEVGEVFAEKPYAIAVQQGSHLQDEISMRILDLQKDRFFENLQAKYWNYSLRGDCSNEDDSEGITLESLGGVFIATLAGLALAMITLAGEVFYYKRKYNKKEKQNSKKEKDVKLIKFPSETVTIGKTFKPIRPKNRTPEISFISVYPRNKMPDVDKS